MTDTNRTQKYCEELRPGDAIWDLSWMPASPGWIESVDHDGGAWICNHPANVDPGDAAMVWSADTDTLQLRTELVNPEDGYCRQCLAVVVASTLVSCSRCGHSTHPTCVEAHLAAHFDFMEDVTRS